MFPIERSKVRVRYRAAAMHGVKQFLIIIFTIVILTDCTMAPSGVGSMLLTLMCGQVTIMCSQVTFNFSQVTFICGQVTFIVPDLQ